MRRTFRRSWTLLLFLVIPGLGAVTPLLVYPAITSRFGAAGFTAVAIGLSVGMTVSAICELGWGVLGPQRIARSPRSTHVELVRSSLATKLLALLLGAPAAVLITWWTLPEQELAGAVTALGAALTALSPSWYLTGLNRPAWILVSDTLPKVLTNLAVAGALLLGAPLLTYGASTIVTSILPIVLVGVLGRESLRPRREDLRSGWAVIRQQGPLTVGRAVSVGYTSLPLTLTSMLAPTAAPLFAATDRIMRMGLTVLAGLPSRLQSYLGVNDPGERARRIRRVLIVNALLGLVAAAVFVLVMPLATDLVFTGTIHPEPLVTGTMGAVVLAVCTSRGYGLCLVAQGKANLTIVVTGCAALTGVTALFVLVPPWGALGAALAVLMAEVVGIVVQMLLVHRRAPVETASAQAG